MKSFKVTKSNLCFGLGEDTVEWEFTVRARYMSDVKNLLRSKGFNSSFIKVSEVHGKSMLNFSRFLERIKTGKQ